LSVCVCVWVTEGWGRVRSAVEKVTKKGKGEEGGTKDS